MIKIENLTKSFNGNSVLNGISFGVKKGEIIALIGRSGCGKSVLLKHVVRLMRPSGGRILVDGKDINDLRGKDLVQFRQRLGFLFQSGALFDSMTVFENVAFPLREKTPLGEKVIRERVFHELEEVGLIGAENKHPSQISGGMVKRAALARELVWEPEIMLFDEPTTGLDPIIGSTILNLIDSCHKRLNFTGFIVTHEIPKVFQIVDRVAMLHEGKVLLVGIPEEILCSEDPVVQQFITGSPEGPLPHHECPPELLDLIRAKKKVFQRDAEKWPPLR
ncbi:MAG: ABC transporter ATP-binding protein [Pseudomonadota bacterium]